MATPNTRIREARERTPSRLYPAECLSRQELADQVNAYLWTTHGQRVEIDAGYVGKLERGVIRWPGSRYREAFRSILKAPADAELGFRAARRVATRPPAELWPSPDLVPAPPPSPIGIEHVQEVSAAAEMITGWHHRHGGWSMREAVLAQARWSSRLLDVACPSQLRDPLYAAIAHQADVCGFMLFDTGDYEQAERCFRFALACAEHAGDWNRRAIILGRMARQALWIGQPDQALTFSEYGLVRVDRTPAKRPMLHVARAKALAALGHTQDAIRALGEADEAFLPGPADDDSGWSSFYTPAQHAGDSAQAWATLHIAGHRTPEAHTGFAAARDGYGGDYPRSRALAELKLATLVMAAGDPHEAAALGTAALVTARPIRSRRITDLLVTLGRLAARQRTIPAVHHLRHEIATTLGTAP